MESCCTNTYNNTFGSQKAAQEYRDYLKKGPKKSTEYLLEPLKLQTIEGATLLDIGGGVGVLVWELWDLGISRAYYQEISEAYSQTFRQEVQRRGLEQVIEIRTGDFVESAQLLPQADIVTLDKVICCYEDFETLVGLSAAKARATYGYTIPVDVWWVKSVAAAGSFLRRLWGDKLRTYVHDTAEVEALTLDHGFQKIYQKQHREWLTVLYQKI